MGFDIKYSREDETLIIEISGERNNEDSGTLTKQILNKCKEGKYNNILVDRRKYIQGSGRSIDLIDLHSKVKDIPLNILLTTQKAAIVVKDDEYEEFKLIEVTAQNRGHNTRIFTDIDEAKKWLNTE